MIEKEKKEFGAWWLWLLMLIVVAGAVFTGMRFFGVASERVIFENSYQKSEGDKAQSKTLRATLFGLQQRLRAGNLSESERSTIEAQIRAVQYQINLMEQ